MTAAAVPFAIGPNTERLRVLLINHELNPGAPSIPANFLAHATGVDVFTVAFGPGALAPVYAGFGKLAIVPGWSAGAAPRVRRKLALRALRRAIVRFAPHLVYVNSVGSLHHMTVLKLDGIPMLLHVHELDSYLLPAAQNHPTLLLKRPAAWIAPTACVVNALVKVGVPRASIATIPEFISDATFAGADVPKVRSGTFVAGGAGHVSWRKGTALWLQTAAAVRALDPTLAVEFRWVGVSDNQDSEAMRQLVRVLQLEGIVKLIPKTPVPLAHFREFDVFVMSSLEDPSPLVVVENMALRTPVLCFGGGGGAPEQVNETGVVIDGFDPQAMASEIVRLARDPARRNALGRAARERAGHQFVASVQAPRILQELRRVAGWPTS